MKALVLLEPRCKSCGGPWTCVSGSPECENAKLCPCDLALCEPCFHLAVNQDEVNAVSNAIAWLDAD